MNIEDGADLEFCQAQERTLRPYAELWKNDLFQSIWVKEGREFMDALKDASLTTDWESQEGQLRLKVLGLKTPKTQEEEVRLYIAIRSVLSVWKWKLGIIETQATNYGKTIEKLNELGRHGSAGLPRIAAP